MLYVCRIIFPFMREISYLYALFAANLNSLHSRCHDISKSFFQDICDPSSCIHHLLTHPYGTSVLSRLRTVTPLPRLTSRTKNIVPSFYLHKIITKKVPKLTQNSTLPKWSSFSALYIFVLVCYSTTVLYLSI